MQTPLLWARQASKWKRSRVRTHAEATVLPRLTRCGWRHISCRCRWADCVRHGERRAQSRSLDRHPARGKSGRAQRDVRACACRLERLLHVFVRRGHASSVSDVAPAWTRLVSPLLARRDAAPSGATERPPQPPVHLQPRQQQHSARRRCRAQTRALPPAPRAAGDTAAKRVSGRDAVSRKSKRGAARVPYACARRQPRLRRVFSTQQEAVRALQARV